MEEINLADLHFDFENYFHRHSRGEMDEAEAEEFDARVIGIFCRRMLLTGTANQPWNEHEDFAARFLAKKLEKVIGGVRWRKSFSLPFEWGTFEPDNSRTDLRAIGIYCAVQNAQAATPALAVTALIQQQADAQCVSFETARADYYKVKKSMDAGTGLRPFLSFD